MAVRRILAAVLTAPLLTLAACGGGGGSIADPPISSAPSSSTPTQQRETPEHFIRRWAAEEKRMENTGDTVAYLAMSKRCLACRQLARDIKSFYAAGGYAKWGGWQIKSIKQGGETGTGIAYEVRVQSLPTTYKESAAADVRHLKGGPSTHQLTVKRVGGVWQVTAKAQLAT